MISHKQCINVPTATYSGKEMSPLRYGISAEEFDVGLIKEGHDGLNWIVKVKNNRKVWVRISVPNNKMVHEIHKVGKNDADITDDVTNKNDIGDKDTQEESIDEEQPMIKEKTKDEKNQKNVGEKKLTNYNIFLAYRLNKLKEQYSTAGDKKTNKEIFAEVLAEWKNIDKKSQEFKDVMKDAEEFKNNK